MKKLLIIYSAMFFFISCNNESKRQNHSKTVEYQSPKNEKKEINLLIEKAINEGDTLSYNRVSSIYALDGSNTEFYFFSLLMANKFNYSKAYFDLYTSLNQGEIIDNIKMYSSDKNTRKLSNYYLLKAYELGLKDELQLEVKKVFGSNIPDAENYLCSSK